MSSLSAPSSVQPLTLNQNFTINTRKEYVKNTALYAVLRTASIVAYLFTIAIAATVLAFSFMATGGATMPLFMIGVALLSIPFCWLASKMWHWATPYKIKADEARGVSDREKIITLKFAKSNLEQIAQGTKVELDAEKIRADLKVYGIEHDSDTLQQIARQLPKKKDGSDATEEDALKSFIPLIARLQYSIDTLDSSFMRSEELHSTPTKKASARLEHDQLAYSIFETSAMSSILRISHIVHVMANPFAKATRLEDLGSLNIKPMDLRTWDRQYRNDDSYFVHQGKNLQPINYTPVREAVLKFVEQQNTYLQRATEIALKNREEASVVDSTIRSSSPVAVSSITTSASLARSSMQSSLQMISSQEREVQSKFIEEIQQLDEQHTKAQMEIFQTFRDQLFKPQPIKAV